MYCKHCGQKLDDSSRFCQNCGAPVEAAPAQPQTNPQPQARPQKQDPTPAAAPAQKPAKKGPGLATLVICIAVFVIYMATSNSSPKRADSQVVTRPTISLTSPQPAGAAASTAPINPEYDRMFSSMGLVDSDHFPTSNHCFIARMQDRSVQKFEFYTPMGDQLSQFMITVFVPVHIYPNLEAAEQAIKDAYRPCVNSGCAVLYPTYATKDYYVLPMLFSSLTTEKNLAALYENHLINSTDVSYLSYPSFRSVLLDAGYVER